MAINTSPVFTITPNIGVGVGNFANTASDGTGSLVNLFTAGSYGSRIERIRYFNAQATAGSCSNMCVRFFITNSTGGSVTLLSEAAIATTIRSASVIGAYGIITFTDGLVVPGGTMIKAAQSVYAGSQDVMHYVVEGGDY